MSEISDAAVDAFAAAALAAGGTIVVPSRDQIRAGLAAALPHTRRAPAPPITECIHCDSPARPGSSTCGECPDSVAPDTTHVDGAAPGTSAWGAC